jgi:hypothetical protein
MDMGRELDRIYRRLRDAFINLYRGPQRLR